MEPGILHVAAPPFAYAVGPGQLGVMLQTPKGRFLNPQCAYADRYDNTSIVTVSVQMELDCSDETYDYWTTGLELASGRFRYGFILRSKEKPDRPIWYTESGTSCAPPADPAEFFQYPYISASDLSSPPDWAKGAVVYQVFPDRFARSRSPRRVQADASIQADADIRADAGIQMNTRVQTDSEEYTGREAGAGKEAGARGETDAIREAGTVRETSTNGGAGAAAELTEWGQRPRSDSLFGGDLGGIIEHLEHLEAVGADCLYLTPILKSPTSHRYDTSDYYSIDPMVGDVETAKRLVKEAHARGMKVVLDAVFNHCGSGFFAFRDVVEKGRQSKYYDWFYIQGKDESGRLVYETFANSVRNMPKLRTENAEVREYLINVAEYWTCQLDIDGWRLDVANEVDFRLWQELRNRLKAIKPSMVIVGEIWHEASRWLRGDALDSVTNYPFRRACLRFFAERSIRATEFEHDLAAYRVRYRPVVNLSLWNVLDSHDTERFLTSCQRRYAALTSEESAPKDAELKGSESTNCGTKDSGRKEFGLEELAKRSFMLAVAFQFTYPGSPVIYYGDEVGMTGLTDPDCRRCMVFDESEQDKEILCLYSRLGALRRRVRVLRTGAYRCLAADDEANVLVYARYERGKSKTSAVVVILNNGYAGYSIAETSLTAMLSSSLELSGNIRWRARVVVGSLSRFEAGDRPGEGQSTEVWPSIKSPDLISVGPMDVKILQIVLQCAR